ncbi:unnamed protein product [Arctogadus glacialis]
MATRLWSNGGDAGGAKRRPNARARRALSYAPGAALSSRRSHSITSAAAHCPYDDMLRSTMPVGRANSSRLNGIVLCDTEHITMREK